MYLKVLYYVDEEIVQGVGGIRAPKERNDLDAGMRVKDCLRDNYISSIFQSWYGWTCYVNVKDGSSSTVWSKYG